LSVSVELDEEHAPTAKVRSLLRTVTATRYVTPLREGGSLPAIVEADDLGTYVLKFRKAGKGRKALIAELVAGEIARVLGLAVPEIVLARLDSELGRTEPDPEIQDLIKAISFGRIRRFGNSGAVGQLLDLTYTCRRQDKPALSAERCCL
jgi:hypothetical protein